MTTSPDPTEQAITLVRERYKCSRMASMNYIGMMMRGNLICLDCGSENHTRGHTFCTYGRDEK